MAENKTDEKMHGKSFYILNKIRTSHLLVEFAYGKLIYIYSTNSDAKTEIQDAFERISDGLATLEAYAKKMKQYDL